LTPARESVLRPLDLDRSHVEKPPLLRSRDHEEAKACDGCLGQDQSTGRLGEVQPVKDG